ncbi:MAG: hypothetical protein ABL895_17290 [Cyclobacteriaceae bacterium]
MKTWNRRVMLFVLMVGGTAVYAQQNREEVPGDHFSLQGALEVFKKSASPEEFERLLNSPDAGVNNLDLNGDGDIDYIRVIDRNEGNVHAFILQAVINERESQDVAVIELEKLANGKAVLQITGDADIYGIETIIEPTEEVRINAGTSTAQTVVNVWAWPSVQYVYGPYYSRWNSPWSWNHRPYWWNPWRPTTYIAYYPRWESYYSYYSVCNTHRVRYAHTLYRPYRSTSIVVYNRHQTQITNYRASRSYAGNTRGRDDSRDNTQRGDYERSRSLTSERDNSRSSGNDWKRNESRRNTDWNQTADNRRTPGTRDESVGRNRTNPNVTREPSGSQRTFREQRDDSRNRSNQVNTNSERTREFRTAPETRQRVAPQVERRESGSSGGQRSAPQLERKQSSGNSGQRSGPVKSGDNKRGRD